MRINKLYVIAAFLGTTLAGCQKAEEIIPDEKPEVKPATEFLTLTVKASKSIDTKALNMSNGVISTSWRQGETVSVYLGGKKLGTLEATPDSNDATSAELNGKIKYDSGLEEDNTELTLIFPGREDGLWTYQGQDGSAPSATGTMATGFDYAMASLPIDTVGETEITVTGTPTFETQQSIFCFSFKDKTSGNPISVKEVTFYSSEFGKIVQSRSYDTDWTSFFGSLFVKTQSATNQIYVSVRNENESISKDDMLHFTVVGEDKTLYLGTKKISKDADVRGYGKFIGANVKLSQAEFEPTSEVTTNTAI